MVDQIHKNDTFILKIRSCLDAASSSFPVNVASPELDCTTDETQGSGSLPLHCSL